MDGADLAFYKGRSRYHTKYDAVQYTDGGVRSLWAMIEAAQGVSGALLSSEAVHGDKGGAPVYFDRKFCLVSKNITDSARSVWTSPHCLPPERDDYLQHRLPGRRTSSARAARGIRHRSAPTRAGDDWRRVRGARLLRTCLDVLQVFPLGWWFLDADSIINHFSPPSLFSFSLWADANRN